MITLPENTDLVRLTQIAYNLSRPVGMGFLHFVPGDLPEEAAKTIVESQPKYPAYGDKGVVLSLDYIAGRAVKLTVWEHKDGHYLINDEWYDHSDDDLKQLLENLQDES